MQAHAFSLEDEAVTESLYQSVVAAFNEDRRMIEAQQRMIDLGAADDRIILSFDRGLIQFRRATDSLLHWSRCLKRRLDRIEGVR